MIKNVIVIGAGPTGLFASSLLLKEGFSVDLYDQKTEAGRKLLLAGKSGLNLTNNLALDSFITAYGCRQKQMKPSLTHFSQTDLRLWLNNLGVKTFVGSSGAVFPISKGAKELLSLWMKSLNSNEYFKFHPGHRLVQLEKDYIYFKTDNNVLKLKAPLLVMGLGGASYPTTGSDGTWHKILKDMDITIKPFKPMNCGFECSWSSFFKQKVNRLPLKNIKLTFQDQSIRGEFMITPYGIEGGPVYRLSREFRTEIEKNNKAIVFIDLSPDLTKGEILHRINRSPGKNSLSNHLRKQVNLSTIKISLLRELTEKSTFKDFTLLAQTIKQLPLILKSPRPIEEAISSSGGVSFNELDDYFMLKKNPGWFTAGEMVDWDAPTGGYLLQGCFSTAFRVVEGIQKL
ncbi:MAG: TIGR03862 family flavoprotein [Spirochaetales bacterium]|nr:TIGR03862 family flavoprotein [Spirochaetales bacterium]